MKTPIEVAIEVLVRLGYDVGPRCGALTAVNGVWRDNRWVLAIARRVEKK